MASHSPRIAWFSPLHLANKPSPTLSAYVSELLLPELRKQFDVTVFHNSFTSYKDFPTAHYLSAAKLHQENPFNIFFYQLEDHLECNFIRQYCGVMPGAVWFHDFLFTSHGPEPILNSPFEDVISHFNSEEYDFRERGFEYEERERSGVREAGLSALRFFSREIALSECKRRVENSLQLEAMQERAGACYLPIPIPNSHEVPHVPNTTDPFRVLFCGSVQLEHRSHKLLKALADLGQEILLVWLLTNSERAQAEELVKEFGLSNVELRQEKSPRAWEQLVKEPGYRSVAVHTHFSVYGQTGPYLAISFSAGLPTLISDFGGAEFVPNNFTFKIEPGQTEASQMKEVLSALLHGTVSIPHEEVIQYARENYSVEHVVAELSFALQEYFPAFHELNARWSKLQEAACQELTSFALSTNFAAAERELFGENFSHGTERLTEVFRELGFV